MSVDAIREQLLTQKAVFKYGYGSDALDPWITEQLAQAIARNGTTDIRDIRLYVGPGDPVLAENVFRGFNPSGDAIGFRGFDLLGNKIDFSAPLDASLIVPDISYYYNIKTGRQFEGADFGTAYTSTGVFLGVDLALYGRDFFTRFESDDFIVTVTVNYTGSGLIFFYAKLTRKVKDKSVFSDIVGFLAPIAPIVGLGLNFLVPGMGSAIGNAVLGAFDVVAPAFAQAIGNAAISTALNGGDIENAVKGQVLGFGSGFVGQFAAGTFDSELIGKLAGAATSAAVSGGDLKTAVLGTALTQGAREMNNIFGSISDWFTGGTTATPTDEFMGPPDDLFTLTDTVSRPVLEPLDDWGTYDGSYLNADTGWEYVFPTGGEVYPGGLESFANEIWNFAPDDFMGPPDSLFQTPTAVTSVFSNAPDFMGPPDSLFADPTVGFIEPPSPYIDIPNLPPLSPSQQSGTAPGGGSATSGDSWGFGDIVAGVTAAAMAAQRLVQAYQQARNPAIVRAGTVNNGQTVTANPNGTITVRNPVTGTSTVTLPPVGVPHQAADGSLVTNNGNGTYTVVRPDGSSATGQYSQGALNPTTGGGSTGGGFLGLGSDKTLIYAALGVGALLLLKGK